jgi:hypothetical protein
MMRGYGMVVEPRRGASGTADMGKCLHMSLLFGIKILLEGGRYNSSALTSIHKLQSGAYSIEADTMVMEPRWDRES